MEFNSILPSYKALEQKLLIFPVAFLLLFSSVDGVSSNQDIRVENGEGFLVHPIVPTLYPVDTQSVERQSFYIYNQNTATKISSHFGSLRAEQNITYALNDYSNADPLSLKVVNIDGHANITAHLVQTTVTNTKPNLKVLVHSDHHLQTSLCVRVFAKKSNLETVSGSCFLEKDGGAESEAVICMATVPLPYEWWSFRDIDVYFDVQSVEVCTLNSNYLPSFTLPDDAFSVGEVVLMFDDRHGNKEIREDANIGLSVPDRPQQVGQVFTAAVKLYPASEVDLFVVRVELGDGLTLKSVNSSDPRRWTVRMRRAGSKSVVDIEALAAAGVVPSLKVQEVIKLNFEVSRPTVELEANIRWTMEYVTTKGEQIRTILTPIPLSRADQITHLVPVLKTHELVSLRQLTDTVPTVPVWLYAIDRSGRISLVNSKSKCRSTRSSILEVSKQCDMIYLSGEGSDPSIVEVLFEYNKMAATADVRVWYPAVQMSIKLTDDRLHEVKGWKVKAETNQAGRRDVNAECYPRYQTSDVRVYTKFYTVHDRRDVYMRGGKVEVFADVTRYVQHLIQSSNKNVVRYENGLIVGVTPGKATIKVVSLSGATLAASDVKVVSSKVEVNRISGNFVSDFNMVVTQSSEQGLLVATFNYERALSDKLAEGVLELWVHFDDGKVVPLSSFDRRSYDLEIENETPTIIALVSEDYTNRYIKVKAVGSGEGALKLTLRMDSACQRKTSKYLAVGYMYIRSEISKPAGLFVNDAAYKTAYQNKPPSAFKPLPHKPLSAAKPNSVKAVKPALSKTSEVKADQTKEHNAGGVTPLETGMFVLMGILGVVASVFVTNCLVYSYRQKLKRAGSAHVSMSDGSEKVDNGWVWLNRSTLEENAINTSPEPLLSEKDFIKRCSRSDSLQSTRSKRSSIGTYKGSECSIRITVNPRNILNLPEMSDSEEELYSADDVKQPIIGIEEPEVSDMDEEECYSRSSSMNRRRQSGEGDSASNDEECEKSFIIHDDVCKGPQSPSFTQEEFDNLRESVA